MNLYLSDILDQPAALRRALQQSDLTILAPLRRLIDAGRIRRLILTGMGASYYGLYPAWLHLAGAGLPAVWVDAAELVHHAPGLIDQGALVWVASQSGRSAEIVALLKLLEQRPPGGLIGLTNDPEGPLGRGASAGRGGETHVLLPLHADPELAPSTRTYLNTLAISQLAALALIPDSRGVADLKAPRQELERTADAIEAYLSGLEGVAMDMESALADGRRITAGGSTPLVLLGRGVSLTSALAGALGLQEAAKMPALGLQAAEFRHGPLEMVAPGLTIWIFEGEAGSTAAALNRKLLADLRGLGANAWLLGGGQPGVGAEAVLPHPSASGIGLPLAEIIPLQLLNYQLALQAGFEPGAFRHIGKVTVEE